jgi:hypothetical protein
MINKIVCIRDDDYEDEHGGPRNITIGKVYESCGTCLHFCGKDFYILLVDDNGNSNAWYEVHLFKTLEEFRRDKLEVILG